MIKPNTPFTLGAIALIALIALNSVFTVAQYETGFVRVFGKIERDANGEPQVYGPGLHVRWPFITKIVRLDRRIQTMDRPAERVGTSEKKDMMVDLFVKWRIRDFQQFYLRTQGDTTKASLLLERIVNNALRNEFGRNTITDVISERREEIMENIRNEANSGAPELGIEIVDVRVKQANLPVDVSKSVYERMREERNRVATQLRSEGRKLATVIRAEADKRVTIMKAEARLAASRLRADADAAAARIYADAYNKDPEFFDFLRSLQAYENSMTSGTDIMVLSPDGEFFKYFGKAGKTPAGR
jgi:membrane protease subunit HflC